ncbi:MAG: GTPase domain-containing protein [Candidatus Thorarchaeota archaeon]
MSSHSDDSGFPEHISPVVKMIILGDGAVGKTTLVQAISNYIRTLGEVCHATIPTNRTRFLDFHTISSTSKSPCTISLFDVQGQLRGTCHPVSVMGRNLLGSVCLALFIFAVNDYPSFEHLFSDEGWYGITKADIEENSIPFFLIGNKTDSHNHEVISKSVEKIGKKYQTYKGYFETSAITGQGIPELVENIQKFTKPQFIYTIMTAGIRI